MIYYADLKKAEARRSLTDVLRVRIPNAVTGSVDRRIVTDDFRRASQIEYKGSRSHAAKAPLAISPQAANRIQSP
jgi:hypothetical protein